MRAIFASITLTVLIGCTQFPQFDSTISPAIANAPFPQLVPLEGLVFPAQANAITPELQTDLQARIARLKSRAAHLRRTVVDAPTRRRMANGVQL